MTGVQTCALPICNRGDFATTLPLFWRDGGSPFRALLALADGLFARLGATHGIPLEVLVEALFGALVAHGVPPADAAAALWRDYAAGGRRRHPPRGLRRHLA